ncbi:hypothetical protein HED63_27155 [Ochrobactrum cytisi]|nr:hypothetical protein [Brucella cytisi]
MTCFYHDWRPYSGICIEYRARSSRQTIRPRGAGTLQGRLCTAIRDIAPEHSGSPARLADTRRQGYAESIDEAVRGVRAISVAVGDPRTGDEAALCISFPDAIVSSEERQVIIRHLSEGAEQIAALVKDTKFIPVAN